MRRDRYTWCIVEIVKAAAASVSIKVASRCFIAGTAHIRYINVISSACSGSFKNCVCKRGCTLFNFELQYIYVFEKVDKL